MFPVSQAGYVTITLGQTHVTMWQRRPWNTANNLRLSNAKENIQETKKGGCHKVA